jgi:hypothetical protein
MYGRIATRLLLGPIGSQKLWLICEEDLSETSISNR